MRNNQNTPQPRQSHNHKSYTHTGNVMFLWVFRATVLAHWIARHNRTAARVRRARSTGVSQSNKSWQAFIPFGPRLYVTAARRSVNVAMNFRYGWTLNQHDKLVVKTEKTPNMDLFASNRDTVCMHLHFNPYGMNSKIYDHVMRINIVTCIESYLKIFVHGLAIELLGKRWCQCIMILHT